MTTILSMLVLIVGILVSLTGFTVLFRAISFRRAEKR